jgi:hypothetical protein
LNHSVIELLLKITHDATPAVSVRSLLLPKLTGVNPSDNAVSISGFEKSPSGPIIVNTGLPREIIPANDTVFSSQ